VCDATKPEGVSATSREKLASNWPAVLVGAGFIELEKLLQASGERLPATEHTEVVERCSRELRTRGLPPYEARAPPLRPSANRGTALFCSLVTGGHEGGEEFCPSVLFCSRHIGPAVTSMTHGRRHQELRPARYGSEHATFL
jgi:hypothetical protein